MPLLTVSGASVPAQVDVVCYLRRCTGAPGLLGTAQPPPPPPMAQAAAYPARTLQSSQAAPTGCPHLHRALGRHGRTGAALLACCVRRGLSSQAGAADSAEAALAHADLQLLGAEQVPVYVFGALHGQAQVLSLATASYHCLISMEPAFQPYALLRLSCSAVLTVLAVLPLHVCSARCCLRNA